MSGIKTNNPDKMKLLIVDDSMEMRKSIRSIYTDFELLEGTKIGTQNYFLKNTLMNVKTYRMRDWRNN